LQDDAVLSFQERNVNMKGASDPSRVWMSGPVVGFSNGLVRELQALGYATTTAAELMRMAAHLSRWLQGSGLGLAELTPSVIDAFVAERRSSHANLAFARALDPIVSYLRRVGAVPEPLPAVPQLDALLAAADELRPRFRAVTFRTLLSLQAATGIRTGEAIGLDVSDLDLDQATLTVTGKYGRTHLLPLHPTVDRSSGTPCRNHPG